MLCGFKFHDQLDNDNCSKIIGRSCKTHCFFTGSKYNGTIDNFGMAGKGKYIFSNGVTYKGVLCDGLFHGTGTLEWPDGHRIDGVWVRGVLQEKRLTFPDGLVFNPIDLTNYNFYAQRLIFGQRLKVEDKPIEIYNEKTNSNELYIQKTFEGPDNYFANVILPASSTAKNKHFCNRGKLR